MVQEAEVPRCGMITKITVTSFKSIENAEIELGNLNVFVGANGSGKSNLLEAIGVLSAAADGKVNDQRLSERGVRLGDPKLYKSAFPPGGRQVPDIAFSGSSQEAHYDVSLNNPVARTRPSWRFETELLERGSKELVRRDSSLRNSPNTEIGLAAIKAVELKEDDPALALIRRLQNFVIYSPSTPVLRGGGKEDPPRQPLGLSGGRLPDAVHELIDASREGKFAKRVCDEALQLIPWAKTFGSVSSPRKIMFFDKYMKRFGNLISGDNASEGAMYVLFMAVLD